MRDLLRRIDSLHHLAAFDAAARHGSFTRAAEELNVSQPAISQSIRKLEQAIGVKLFQRMHRSIVLTDAGVLLAHDVGEAFGRIHATVAHLGRIGRSDHVTLSVSTAFANYWMVPRLQAFHQRYPDVDLRLQTTDKELDLAHEGISLGVRRGIGRWEGYSAALIAPERLIAVTSPGWLEANTAPETIAELAGMPLTHLEEPYRTRPGWTDWFRHFGHSYRDPGTGLRLNDYALVLQATMAGEGIALGFGHVVEGLIAQGLLVQIGSSDVFTGPGYYLVWSERQVLSQSAQTVRDWILDPRTQQLLALDAQGAEAGTSGE
ncbi:MAG: LysR substrate-binding domain-containing protein [Pseudomonadota bacterium]